MRRDSSMNSSARQRTRQGRLALMFERHSGALGRTLRRQGLSVEAAEDATQQAFLIVSERLDEIRPGRERAFLFAVLLRVTSSRRRRLVRYQFEADMDAYAAPGSAQDEANERVLALELFNQVLERLDRDLAQAFVLFELEQLSKNEVARELGIPPGTAASRRRRARQTVEATMARLQIEIREPRRQRFRGAEPARQAGVRGVCPGGPSEGSVIHAAVVRRSASLVCVAAGENSGRSAACIARGHHKSPYRESAWQDGEKPSAGGRSHAA